MSSIQSVKRAFDILQAVSQLPEGATLTEIAEATQLPKSTVSRMLTTLEELEAVDQVYAGGTYRIGRGIARLVAQPSWLVTVSNPRLQALAAESGESVSLAVMEGDQLLYLTQYNSPKSNIRIRDWSGTHVPMLHIASPGKLFLAHDAYLYERYTQEPLEGFTKNTIVSIEALDAALEQVRRQGYAWVREEFERGLYGVSAPIFDRSGGVVAALNLYGPSFRLPDAGDPEELFYSQLVMAVAAEISAQLAGEKHFITPSSR